MAQDSTDATGRLPLPLELRAATRKKHHALNIEITKRLPLCLSPQVESPLVYAKGMAAFGQVYFAFEGVLATSLAGEHLEPRLREIYEIIHMPQLIRTSRLRNDIDLIKSRLDKAAMDEIQSVEEEAKAFYMRIHDLLSWKPHVLLGYAWAMYLALFNGGRWIHKQLASQGSGFWRGEPLPLSFWEFEGNGKDDPEGDQLKVLFQERFNFAASLLRDEEKDDVVNETIQLFKLCSEIVHALDDKMAAAVSSTVPTPSSTPADSEGPSYLGATSPLAATWDYLASSYSSLRRLANWA
ncbi:hypothetical protein ABEF95_011441 [Exophiala dermatitidis]